MPVARRFPPLTAFLVLAALSGCGIAKPYVDSRREAGKHTLVGQSNPDRIAICYRGGNPPPPDVVKLADSACAETGRVAKFESKSRFACNLLTPTRGFFRCMAPPKPAP